MTERNRNDDSKNHGEGNPEADRHYREGVEKTVKQTSEEERAEKARKLDDEDKSKAREAEKEGKSHARK